PKMRYLKIGIGLLFSLCFKPYILGLLLLSYFFYLVIGRFKKVSPMIWFSSVFFFLFLGVFLTRNVENGPLTLLTNKQVDFDNIGRGGVYFTKNQTFFYVANEQRDKIQIIGDSVRVIETIPIDIVQKYPIYK